MLKMILHTKILLKSFNKTILLKNDLVTIGIYIENSEITKKWHYIINIT